MVNQYPLLLLIYTCPVGQVSHWPQSTLHSVPAPSWQRGKHSLSPPNLFGHPRPSSSSITYLQTLPKPSQSSDWSVPSGTHTKLSLIHITEHLVIILVRWFCFMWNRLVTTTTIINCFEELCPSQDMLEHRVIIKYFLIKFICLCFNNWEASRRINVSFKKRITLARLHLPSKTCKRQEHWVNNSPPESWLNSWGLHLQNTSSQISWIYTI